MKSNYKPIGYYIQLVDERNAGHEVKNLLGLSISKQFIPSVANIIGTDMENYKIIRRNQFACSTMQVRRDKKMPVALLQEVDEAIISQAYPIFEIAKAKELLPEYLMMWFARSEFDREACFNAVGGVRGSLEWEDFCDMKLPIPSITKQKEIVKEYNVIQNRIALNRQLIQKLEETAQAIYKQWFVDFQFPFDFTSTPLSTNAQGKPDVNGCQTEPAEVKPYKSNGGEMVFNEELEKEIPKGWEVKPLADLSELKYGKMLDAELFLESGYPIFSGYGVRGYYSEYMFEEPQILVLCRGVSGTGKVKLSPPFAYITNLSIIVESKQELIKKMFLFYFLKNGNLRSLDSGSAQSQITTGDLYVQPILVPSIFIQTKFNECIEKLMNKKELHEKGIGILDNFQSLLLSKLATVED
ncbi:MAG: restriction endonuclease subunit S [Mariniphaga sp.]